MQSASHQLKKKWQRRSSDERKWWQGSCCNRCCLSGWFHKASVFVASQVGCVTLDALPRPFFPQFALAMFDSFNVLRHFVWLVFYKGNLASWLKTAENSPRGDESVDRMNIHGTVTETSTSPDLCVILDFSHLVQLARMLSRSQPVLWL